MREEKVAHSIEKRLQTLDRQITGVQKNTEIDKIQTNPH
jgi:hypothetical protein